MSKEGVSSTKKLAIACPFISLLGLNSMSNSTSSIDHLTSLLDVFSCCKANFRGRFRE